MTVQKSKTESGVNEKNYICATWLQRWPGIKDASLDSCPGGWLDPKQYELQGPPILITPIDVTDMEQRQTAQDTPVSNELSFVIIVIQLICLYYCFEYYEYMMSLCTAT